MPRYHATIPSRWNADTAFAYMADFRNAEEWDPGVLRAERPMPGEVTPGTAFDLVVSAAGRELPLRYEVVA